MKKLYDKEIQINIFEVKRPELDATIVANNIARQVEGKIAYRRAMTKVGILGIKVWICRGEIYGNVDLAPNFAQEKTGGRSNGGGRGGDRKFRNKKK